MADSKIYKLNPSSGVESLSASRKTGWFPVSDLYRTAMVRRLSARYASPDAITIKVYADENTTNEIFSGTLRRTSGNIKSATNTNVFINGGDITATATTTSISDATNISVGDYIKLDSEIMFVKDVSSNTLTMDRGRLGTTAASHTDLTLAYYASPKFQSLRVGRRAKHLMVEASVADSNAYNVEINRLEFEVDEDRV